MNHSATSINIKHKYGFTEQYFYLHRRISYFFLSCLSLDLERAEDAEVDEDEDEEREDPLLDEDEEEEEDDEEAEELREELQ